MNEITVKHNGRWFNCWYKKMSWGLMPRAELCPLCRKRILEEDEVYLFINNYLMFPNVVCHERCVGEVNEQVIKDLADSYLEAKEAMELAKPWFPYVNVDEE